MIRASALALVVLAGPVTAEQNAPDPHTNVMGVFETVCLRGEPDFSDSNAGFFHNGFEQQEGGYWVHPLSAVIGAVRSSEGDVQRICSVGLEQGDPAQFAEALPAVLAGVWVDTDMKRFAGSGGRSDIYMTEAEDSVRAAWVDISEGNIAVLMTSYTRKGDAPQ